MSAWTCEQTRTLPATPEEVFAALTDPSRLRQWFAEHVALELHEGGPYRFWGRHTYGTPRSELANQRIKRLRAPELLAFSWPFDGVASAVTIELAPAPQPTESARTAQPATQLTLKHEFPSLPTTSRPQALIDDLWRLQLANLEVHLRGGTGITLPDFTDPRPQVRASIYIDAPREKVFGALIEPEKLNQWIAAAASVEPHAGGRYSYGWNYPVDGRDVAGGPTRILEMVINEKLVTDWPDWRGDAGAPATRVTWLLESVGKGTRVTVIHSGFARTADISDYPFGWSHFLDTLKGVAER